MTFLSQIKILAYSLGKHLLLSARAREVEEEGGKGKSKGPSVKFLLGYHSPYLLPNWLDSLPYHPGLRTHHH